MYCNGRRYHTSIKVEPRGSDYGATLPPFPGKLADCYLGVKTHCNSYVVVISEAYVLISRPIISAAAAGPIFFLITLTFLHPSDRAKEPEHSSRGRSRKYPFTNSLKALKHLALDDRRDKLLRYLS
jgi:hypothetical protein